jgi:PKD repeat protein
MRICITSLFLTFISLNLFGQDCSILSKANSILPDRLCSPLSVNWNVSYTGVNNAGTTVQIRYDWDDGTTDTENTLNPSPGVFEATKLHTYVSTGNKCNYRPNATLVVNGVLCSSSTQQQIVTVWDNDDHNGGHMHINPAVYPICFGNGANVRFQDLTQFNCVPPQEHDVPNLFTRWVQWIYGTDITMTGIPVTVDGTLRTYPFSGPVITLPGPVTGSGVYSQTMNVANDKLIGQYFQVTLRNWNYCNPYDDPNIPGPPVDPVNGDHPPVVTTAIILIVPYPDATITPVDTLCIDSNPVTLHAHDSGGQWSGDGVSGNTFDPGAAGAGDHIISYNITDGNGCSNSDQITITVVPGPVVNIVRVPTLFINDPPVILSAMPPGGSFTGDGVTGNSFNPAAAGIGIHIITYKAGMDKHGCSGIDTIHIKVLTTPPDATITPVDTLCVLNSPVTLIAKDPGGTWSGDGVTGDKFYPDVAGAGNHIISYVITDINGYTASDQITITVVPIPVVIINQVGTRYLTDTPFTLTASPQGGIWSGNGVNGDSFFPDSAGLGNHILTYTTTPDKFGCWNSDTIHINVIMPPSPTAYFAPDTTGCTPLVVKFRNTSENALSYLWDFGDQSYSTENSPTHTYNIPGNYIVSLTAYNIAGQSSRNGLIKVYQKPTAQFSVYPTDVINNSQIVVFTNYSYYGVSWLWNFGDGDQSTEESPWHKYSAEGEYRITLQVTSKDGCTDSSTYLTPVVVAYKTGNIRFPNVFRWNGSGPTGGYWAEGELDDNTFRPFFTNVIEYKLQIYNRWGVLIYESIELHKGWDGYFGNAHLALEGVYVYKVVGRYADGTYFTKVGDVTFLH